MAAINSIQLSKIVYSGQKMFITEHCTQTSYKGWRYPSWPIILIITYKKIWYHIMLLIKPIYSKNISFLQKYFVKLTLKMNTLLNSEAYWGCLQGILIFEFHFDTGHISPWFNWHTGHLIQDISLHGSTDVKF